jgi:triosephosphate isomerase
LVLRDGLCIICNSGLGAYYFTSSFANGSFTFPLKYYSAEQLVDIGCQWVILGHSERRHIIGENDEVIILCAYATGLTLAET